MNETAELITLTRALHLGKEKAVQYHRQHLNPRLAELCEIIEADTPLVRAHGTHIWDAEGNQFLDFVSGFAALNLGHNHPRILEALELANDSVNLIEGLGTLTAALAHNLSALAPGGLERICFLNSGAEAVDASIKLARAATKRTNLVACRGSFHGRSIGALSVSHRREFREPFEPLLPVTFIPYGDSDALDIALRGRDAAGFIVEPIQGEGGIVVPPPGFLRDARDLCTRSGTIFIVDEIQTGLGRTGRLFAVDHEPVSPDVLLLGKALGGGVMPISSVLSRDALWKAAGGGTPRSPFTFPTFGGCTRACAAGLATLEVLLADGLVERSARLGDYLLERLKELQGRQPLISDVRGRGLMVGIEFAPVTQGLATVLSGGVLNHLSREYFTGLLVMELRGRHKILTLSTLNDPNVLRAQPPLIIEKEDIDCFVGALDEILQRIRSFPNAMRHSWQLLARALRA